MQKNSETLASLAAGESGSVVALYGGHGLRSRLAALGFTPGTDVDIVRNSGRGPIIVRVMDSQIALGRGQADRIMVKKR